MLSTLLLVAVSFVVWALVYRSLVEHPLDAIALTLYYLGLQLLLRPFLLAVGADTPFPSELFIDRDVTGLMLAAQALVVVWLLGMWVGARLLTPLVPPATLLFPRSRASLAPRALLALALALSAVALAASVVLWSRYGGPTGLIEASKIDRDVVESRALRSIPLVAALVGIAAFFAAPSGAWLSRVVAGLLVVLDGYLSFTWGARDVPVLSVVAVVGGSLLYGRVGRTSLPGALDWFRDPRWRRRFLLVGALSLGLAFALRAVRDTLLFGDLAPTIEGEGVVRQFAVATNNTFYDTLLLILDDWPDVYDFRGGSDFTDAAVTAVPGVIAGEQEPFVSPAVLVAQTYLDRNNGFPATPVGDWYLNLGVLGVAMGGLVSGLVLRGGQVAMRRFTHDPLVWGFSLVLVLRVFPGGVSVTSLPKWVAIALPIVAVSVALNLLLRRRGTRARAPAPEHSLS